MRWIASVIVICTVFLCASTVNAQKNKVLLSLTSGEDLSGYGKLTKRGVKFKSSETEKPRIYPFYQMEQLKTWVDDTTVVVHRYVRLKEKASKPEVVELLLEGTVSLYREGGASGPIMIMSTGASSAPSFVGPGGTSSPDLYVKKEGEPFAFKLTSPWIPAKYFKNHAAQYFSDCPELVEKILNKEFKSSSAEEMVSFYNTKCTEQE